MVASGRSPPSRTSLKCSSSRATSSGCVMRRKDCPASSSGLYPTISQNARLTSRKTPSSVITTMPTAVRSNASRARSNSMRGGSRVTVLIARPSAQPVRRGGGGAQRRARDALAHARAETLGELLEIVLARREVDDLVGLDHLARHVVEGTQAVGEAELDAFLAGPHEPGERVGRFLEPLAAAFAHDLDELLVDLADHLLGVRLVGGPLGSERIEEVLVLARGVGAPVDAELLHRAGEAEARDDHADRADHARLVDVDLVGGHGDVITAGSAKILHHDVERRVGILRAQPPHLVVDLARLHRA